MGKSVRPSFQWYPRDWLSCPELRACSLEARGLWIDVICLLNEGYPYGFLTYLGKNDECFEITPELLSKIIGVNSKKVKKNLAELEGNGVFSRDSKTGYLYSRRMVRDEEIRLRRADGGNDSQNNPNVPRKKDPPKDTPKDRPKDTSKDTPKDGLAHDARACPSPSPSPSPSTEIPTNGSGNPKIERSTHDARACSYPEAAGEAGWVEPLVAALADVCGQDLDRCTPRMLHRIGAVAESLVILEPSLSRASIAVMVREFGRWHEKDSPKRALPVPEWIPDKWGPFKTKPGDRKISRIVESKNSFVERNLKK